MENKEYVTYLRVSTQRQGARGLGISAQRRMCDDFIRHNNGTNVNEFMDVESGTHRDRKGLWQAIEYCQRNGCGLVIAKLDRLARDVEFTFKVMNTGIDIHFTDMPVVNTMILGVFSAVAQYEREMTSTRTKQALSVKKASGAKLGAASAKYIETVLNKSVEKKKEESMKRGETKRMRHQESRDVQAFLRVLRQVFPDATKDDDPAKWDWSCIGTTGSLKEQIINKMIDYKEFDSEGKLFKKWDFTIDPYDRAQSVKLCSFIQKIKKSFTNK